MISNLKFVITFCFFNIIVAVPNLILIGPPGSGKGTLSQYFVKQYGYTQICAGDIFRKEVREETDWGKKITTVVGRGDYVDDATAFEIMSFYICKALDAHIPFILDGYPRSAEALSLLSTFIKARGQSVEDYYIVHFVTDLDVLAQRILSRIVCNNCHMVFNERFSPSRMVEKCDQCGYALDKRDFDTQEIIVKRIKHYKKEVLPLVELAEKNYGYSVTALDTSKSLQDCYRLYQKLYNNLNQ